MSEIKDQHRYNQELVRKNLPSYGEKKKRKKKKSQKTTSFEFLRFLCTTDSEEQKMCGVAKQERYHLH